MDGEGNQIRNGYEKGSWFELATRLNGECRLKERHGEKILIVIDIYTNVTNVTEKYSNIQPSEVDYIKKKLKAFIWGLFRTSLM